MYCPQCGKRMIWNNDFSEDYDFCYKFTSFFSCDICNILVEKTVLYGDGQEDDVFFTIINAGEYDENSNN